MANVWRILVVVGVLARICCSLSSFGTQDIGTWRDFAQGVAEHGFDWTYRVFPEFNHPPVAAYGVSLIWRVSEKTGLPFGNLFKAVTALGDIATIILLYFLCTAFKDLSYGRRSCALYSICIPSILISAVHGNTDSFCLFFSVAAAGSLELTKKRFLSGLLLGLALNIKLIPVMLTPMLLSTIRSKGELARFLCGLSVGIIPIVVAVLLIGEPFITNVVGYVPFAAFGWGFPLISKVFSESIISLGYTPKLGRNLFFFFILLVSIVNYLRWKLSPLKMAAITFIIFTVFAPAFASQYLIYVAPFLFIHSNKIGFVYSTLTGILLVSCYFRIESLNYIDAPLSICAWFATACMGYYLVRQWVVAPASKNPAT